MIIIHTQLRLQNIKVTVKMVLRSRVETDGRRDTTDRITRPEVRQTWQTIKTATTETSISVTLFSRHCRTFMSFRSARDLRTARTRLALTRNQNSSRCRSWCRRFGLGSARSQGQNFGLDFDPEVKISASNALKAEILVRS